MTHPDFAIFDSFPGAGPALAPRLLAAWRAKGPLPDRRGPADFLRDCARHPAERQVGMGSRSLGVPALYSPDLPRMGCSFDRILRLGCRFLSSPAGSRKRPHAAVRALAFKWIRIAFSLLERWSTLRRRTLRPESPSSRFTADRPPRQTGVVIRKLCALQKNMRGP